MVSNIGTGTVHQAAEDNKSRQLNTTEARQGVVSGRILTILVVSMVLVGVIFAMLWLVGP